MDNTSFGDGTKLLAAAGKFGAGAVNFQVGSSAAETLNVDISTELGNVTTAIGNAAAFTTVATAQAQIAFVDTLVGEIGTARSTLGASMNRLDHTMTNVSNMKQNTQAAVGTLMDADFAAETSNMTKQQLLMNSGISVLSTANSTTQMIGSLLR
nr:flagellin [Ningiella sp. W23]